MRVLLKKDFTIELRSVDKVINVNDSMVSRLEVEVEEQFLLPGERLWVVFSKTKDTPTDDITKEIQLGTDNKTYSVAIPQGVVMQEGTWYFILSARKYYSEAKYFTRKATAPYEFTVAGGLWIDENTSEVVNNGTVQSLYETAAGMLASEQKNAKDIVALQEKDAAQDAVHEAFKQEATEAIVTAYNSINRVETQVTEDIAAIREVADRAASKADNVDVGLSVVQNSSAGEIVASIDDSTFVMTIKMFDRSNNEMSSTQIDLPLESMVVDAEYNPAAGGAIILTLKSGSAIIIPVADIVRGLISESEKGAANGVASLDQNGKVPKEQLPDDIGGGIDDEALKDYVKFTDYATADKAGVVKISDWYGIGCYKEGMSAGIQYVISATNAEIDGKTQRYKPIVPYNQDHAWKVSATTNTETWTDEEKASACETIGALKAQNPEFDGGATRGYVYFIDPNGNQIVKKVQIQENADTIPLRNPNGNFYVGNPTLPYEAANKQYVDDNKGTKLYRHNVYLSDTMVSDGHRYKYLVFESLSYEKFVYSPDDSLLLLDVKQLSKVYGLRLETEADEDGNAFSMPILRVVASHEENDNSIAVVFVEAEQDNVITLWTDTEIGYVGDMNYNVKELWHE